MTWELYLVNYTLAVPAGPEFDLDDTILDFVFYLEWNEKFGDFERVNIF
jgi:hypothetical protein